MAIFTRGAKKLTIVSIYLTFVFAFTITIRKIRVAEIDSRLVLRFLISTVIVFKTFKEIASFVSNFLWLKMAFAASNITSKQANI